MELLSISLCEGWAIDDDEIFPIAILRGIGPVEASCEYLRAIHDGEFVMHDARCAVQTCARAEMGAERLCQAEVLAPPLGCRALIQDQPDIEMPCVCRDEGIRDVG